MSNELTSATFVCAQCGAVAAQLTLSTEYILRQAGFLGVVQESVAPTIYTALAQALAQIDAGAVYDLNELWAPFYCPACQQVYCYAHWQIEQRYDDDFPGWYDSAYGTCPQGHQRLIDD